MPALFEQPRRRFTTIVADTGDIAAIVRHRPRDATTHPSLILKAAQDPRYAPLVRAAAAPARGEPSERLLDRVPVVSGWEILKRIEGRVWTEVDTRRSFDTRATIERARRLLAPYEAPGIPRGRVLIRIASTWEGIRAAEVLEHGGIRCNTTPIFSVAQAQAAADAGATLVSPFVGRIHDGHKRAAGAGRDEAAHAGVDDPRVRSVRAICTKLNGDGYPSEITGARFRNLGRIVALAGCDPLTISPGPRERPAATEGGLERALVPRARVSACAPLAEVHFRCALNEDAMATEKLAEGMRSVAADAVKLRRPIAEPAADPVAPC